MIDRIFGRAEDKNVRYYKVYSKASDTYLYSDFGCTTKIDTSVAKNLYMKGVIVDIAGKMYTAVGYTEASGVATLLFLTAGSGSAATLLELKSVADA